MADETAEQEEERDEAGDDQSEESKKAEEKAEEREAAREKMEKIQEDPPADLEDWPDDAAKYETFGGPEGEHSYEEGPERQLGPSEVRHHEDGSVSVGGDKVDDPDEFKGDPIPGGPTDPSAPKLSGESDASTQPGAERETG
jgi:hypothetical protein